MYRRAIFDLAPALRNVAGLVFKGEVHPIEPPSFTTPLEDPLGLVGGDMRVAEDSEVD